MIFHAVSMSALASLNKFIESQEQREDGQGQVFLEKLKRSNYQVLLIAGDELTDYNSLTETIDEQTLQNLSDAWRIICDADVEQPIAKEQAWQVINDISEPLNNNIFSNGQTIRQLRRVKGKDLIIILLTGSERDGLPGFDLFVLSNLWQFKQGRFPLHASAIKHNNHLYLFTGPSGAGKSTVAAISSEVGDQVIDQDQVLIYELANGGYSADGWGYEIVHCDTPLQAIFTLVQGTEDQLVSLNQTQTARLVFERHSDIFGGILTEEMLKQSFHFSCELARQVPAFELQFRQSPDFWKMIDEQFPD